MKRALRIEEEQNVMRGLDGDFTYANVNRHQIFNEPNTQKDKMIREQAGRIEK